VAASYDAQERAARSETAVAAAVAQAG
jgi:hypothetical protein